MVSPWTCGEHTDVLAQRTFRLLDENMDRLIEFKGLASCLGIHFPVGWKVGRAGGGWYMGETCMYKMPFSWQGRMWADGFLGLVISLVSGFY